MNSGDIKRKFIKFFEKKGHKLIPSSSLLSDDPSVLLTTAGVQQFKPYYTGERNPEKDLGARRVVSIQKCFRTSDIDEVGDGTHLTFFEMLGNFSFGDYWKEEAIEWGYDFLTKELGFSEKRISATYLKGDKESLIELKKYFPAGKIKVAGKEDNFWGPAGDEGPCGPTVEFYVDGIEIWNLVFNQYYCDSSAQLKPLKTRGVDTGMGLERLIAVINNKKTVFDTDLFIDADYSSRANRILADHIRAICFLITDGVRPSNKEAGYILRRLIRRIIAINPLMNFYTLLGQMADLYKLDKKLILLVFKEESAKFEKTLARGLKELDKLKTIDSKSAFKLYESYGLPFEVIKDVSGKRSGKLTRKDFDKEFAKHQKISRVGADKKFGGHGGLRPDLHTATHLLQQALRDVLGDEVEQRGSDINNERTRFDFSFPRKLTTEEIKKVEKIVNQKIKEDLPINFKELPLDEAKKTGALHFFKEKYPSKVKVYYIGGSLKNAYSKEFCGGPHVHRIGEIGKFKIIKEESASSGIRRIKAIVM